VIGVLVHQDLRQQARSRKRLVDRSRGRIRDHDVGLAAVAGVLGANVLDDVHLGRLVLQLLGDLLPDPHQLLAAFAAAELIGRRLVHQR
jgi:hypothetical protein